MIAARDEASAETSTGVGRTPPLWKTCGNQVEDVWIGVEKARKKDKAFRGKSVEWFRFLPL
jgi:hypothetical protein